MSHQRNSFLPPIIEMYSRNVGTSVNYCKMESMHSNRDYNVQAVAKRFEVKCAAMPSVDVICSLLIVALCSCKNMLWRIDDYVDERRSYLPCFQTLFTHFQVISGCLVRYHYCHRHISHDRMHTHIMNMQLQKVTRNVKI